MTRRIRRKPTQTSLLISVGILGFPVVLPALLGLMAFEHVRKVRRDRRAAGYPPFRQPGRRYRDHFERYCGQPIKKRTRYRRARDTGVEQTSRLPIELACLIIDELCRDKEALRVCSLVCRSWVPLCRAYLFSSIIPRRHSAYSFVSLLRSPACTLPLSMQMLHLADSKQWRVLDAVLVELVATGFQVRDLRLDVVIPFKPQNPALYALLGVTKLRILLHMLTYHRTAGQMAAQGLKTVLEAFPTLDSLVIGFDAAIDINEQFLRTLRPPPSAITELIISPRPNYFPADPNRLMEWFLRPEHNLRLKRLGHLCLYTPHVYFSQYMGDLGQSIDTLEVACDSIESRTSIESYFPPTDTFLLPHITTLQIRLAPYNAGTVLEYLKHVLPRLPNLQRLAFRGRRLVIYPPTLTKLGFTRDHVKLEGGVDAMNMALGDDFFRCYRRRIAE